MKRDMELIRAVVLKAQGGDFHGGIPGYTDEEVKYHQALAIEKGLLEGKVTSRGEKWRTSLFFKVLQPSSLIGCDRASLRAICQRYEVVSFVLGVIG